jgi:transposase
MLWNRIIEMRKSNWEEIRSLPKEEQAKRRIGNKECSAFVTQARHALPVLSADVPCEVTREVASRIEAGYKAFRGNLKNWKPGQPRPEPPGFMKRQEYNTLDCWQPDRIKLRYGSGKFGEMDIGKAKGFKVRVHRHVKGDIRSATIKREPDGWYIRLSFAVEDTWKRGAEKEIGVNLGCRNLIARTDGLKVEIPRDRWLDILGKIARFDRVASRRRKGSGRWRKLMELRKKAFKHLVRSREHFLKKWAHRLSRDCSVIAIEKMDIAKMAEESGGSKYKKVGVKAKTILNAAVAKFVDFLKWKCEERHRTLHEVPAMDTTRTCSKCGHINEKIPLRRRTMKCAKCGHKEDREFNAAKNDLSRGRSGPSGSGSGCNPTAKNREGGTSSG